MTRARSDDVPATSRAAAPPASGVILALACVAQFMVVLDVSVVNVALPSVQASLSFTTTGLPWVAGAYSLAFAGFLLLGGRLADLYGTRRVLTAGLVLFAVPSLAGGLANTPALLVAARAAQGLGAAVLAPATLTVLTTTFPEGPRRTRALAVWTAVSLAGGAADGDYLSAVLGPAVLVSIGGGLLNTPLTATATSGVAGSDAGAASGLMNTAKQVGGTLGLAALTAATAPSPANPYGGAFLIMAIALVAVAAASPVLPRRRDAAEPG